MTLFKATTNVAAARRLTRLITKDEITRPIREHPLINKSDRLSYLFNCPICVSVYTSGIVVTARMLFPKASAPILEALALAEIQATLTEIEAQRAALDENYGPPL